MDDRESTMRSRELGEGLRRAMEGAGLHQSEAARRAGMAQSKVSRLLAGKRGARDVDVATFLAVCGVHGAERARLLALCGEHAEPGWLQEHNAQFPAQLVTLVQYEQQALRITDFEPMFVPGLLQTADYADALMSSGAGISDAEVEERVAARMARQELLARYRAPRCEFIVHEAALHTAVGGPSVFSAQLHHLLALAVRPAITLRVLPFAVGAHAGSNGAFRLMEFPTIRPVVYLDGAINALFLERAEQITRYQRIVAALDRTALDAEHSRAVVAARAADVAATLEDHDAPSP